MQMSGVSLKGRELELFPGLSLRFPLSAACARDEDGSMKLLKAQQA